MEQSTEYFPHGTKDCSLYVIMHAGKVELAQVMVWQFCNLLFQWVVQVHKAIGYDCSKKFSSAALAPCCGYTVV